MWLGNFCTTVPIFCGRGKGLGLKYVVDPFPCIHDCEAFGSRSLMCVKVRVQKRFCYHSCEPESPSWPIVVIFYFLHNGTQNLEAPRKPLLVSSSVPSYLRNIFKAAEGVMNSFLYKPRCARIQSLIDEAGKGNLPEAKQVITVFPPLISTRFSTMTTYPQPMDKVNHGEPDLT